MIKILSAAFLILSMSVYAQTKVHQTDWRALHFNSLVADGHNDVLTRVMRGADISKRTPDGQSDLVRMKEGGVDVQVFSVWMGPEYGEGTAFKYANQMIDSLESLVRRNPDKIAIAKTATEAREIVNQKKIAAVIGVEGGHIIENNLHYLEALAQRGMRYLTLTWNNSTSWSTSGEDEALHASSLTHKGLTDFGREVVRKLNQLGVMVDLSHVGEQTFYDALAVTSKPVIVSHSSVYAIAPHYRNLKDDQIRALAKNGGVMCINFYPEFLDSTYARKERAIRLQNRTLEDSVRSADHDRDHANDVIDSLLAKQLDAIRPPLSLLIDHIDYVVKLVGVDYVGLGSDFDGISALPKGMDDVSYLPNITHELQMRGYSDEDIRKILGGNFMRVFEANSK